MEFVIKKSDLVRELQTVTGVVEKRATLPILANLLLETHESSLQIGASDLEVTIRARADATVIKSGSVTLPAAAKLHEIARALPDADVKFKVEDRNQVKITCDRTRFRIPGQPCDDFPKFPEFDESTAIELPARTLRSMIERVSFAITHEDPRYSLNGALFMLKDKTLTMVATDGHRLAYISKTLDVEAGEEQKVIVPRKALNEVSKMTADCNDTDTIRYARSGNHVFFSVGEHKLSSNVLDGTFPQYENVMPKACDTSLDVPTDELAQAVRRVSLLASDRYGRAVKVALSPGKLELHSKTEMGEAEESIALPDYDGPEMSIGFNARYLLDFLGAVGSPSVRLELNPRREGEAGAPAEAGDKPGQLRPEPQGEMSYRYVVMPMHL